jgi:nucleoside-diphosphate-sugar epimerase
MRIGILGGKGFLGSAVSSYLKDNHSVVVIARDNYNDLKGEKFDIFMNFAGNKYGYIANSRPNYDFSISTQLVYDSIFDFKYNKYILISSISVYDQVSHYGFNKKISEDIVQRYCNDNLILRLCSIIDKTNTTGIIPDIINDKPSFASPDSEYQFISRKGLCEVISYLLDKNGIINIGGKGCVKIHELFNILNKPSLYKENSVNRSYVMDISLLESYLAVKTTKEYIEEEYVY